MLKQNFYLLFLLFLTIDLHSQVNFTNSDAIYQMAQTSDGKLWYGSDDGVYSFDGLNFNKLECLNNQTIHFIKEMGSHLWCFSISGELTIVNRKGECSTNYGDNDLSQMSFEGIVNGVKSMNDSSFIISTMNNGVYLLTERSARQFSFNARKHNQIVGFDERSNMLITRGGGILVADYLAGKDQIKRKGRFNFYVLRGTDEFWHDYEFLWLKRNDVLYSMKFDDYSSRINTLNIIDGEPIVCSKNGLLRFGIQNGALIQKSAAFIEISTTNVLKTSFGDEYIGSHNDGLFVNRANYGVRLEPANFELPILHSAHTIGFDNNTRNYFIKRNDNPSIRLNQVTELVKALYYKGGFYILDVNHYLSVYSSEGKLLEVIQNVKDLTTNEKQLGILLFDKLAYQVRIVNQDNSERFFSLNKENLFTGITCDSERFYFMTDSGVFLLIFDGAKIKTKFIGKYDQIHSESSVDGIFVIKGDGVFRLNDSGSNLVFKFPRQIKTQRVKGFYMKDNTPYFSIDKVLYSYDLNAREIKIVNEFSGKIKDVLSERNGVMTVRLSGNHIEQFNLRASKDHHRRYIVISKRVGSDGETIFKANVSSGLGNKTYLRLCVKGNEREEYYDFIDRKLILPSKLTIENKLLSIQYSIDKSTWLDVKSINLLTNANNSTSYLRFVLLAGFIMLLGGFTLIYFYRKRNQNKSGAEVQSAIPSVHNNINVFFIKDGYNKVKIIESQVLFIKGAREYVQFYTEQTKVTTLMTMKGVFEIFNQPEDFIRVHKSYIVRKDKIDKVLSSKVLIIGTHEVPIGKTYVEEVHEFLAQNDVK